MNLAKQMKKDFIMGLVLAVGFQLYNYLRLGASRPFIWYFGQALVFFLIYFVVVTVINAALQKFINKK